MSTSTSTVEPATDSPASSPALLTIAAAAEKLSVSAWFMAEMCKKGEIESVYLGHKTRRIRSDVLDAYIAGLPTQRPEPPTSH